MFAVFPVMRDLHELLWYLAEAMTLPRVRPVREELARAYAETERLTREPAGVLVETDTAAYRREVNTLLRRASELVRAGARGRDLRDADLRGADLSRSVFLLRSQLDAARGDSRTRLPPGARRPAHWPSRP